jgi:hypothetical protein
MPQKTKTQRSSKALTSKKPAKNNRILTTGKRLSWRNALLFVLLFALGGWFLHSALSAATVFGDNFNSYADGLITSEYTFWNPGAANAKPNPNWEMTSGSLFAATLAGEKVAYSGVPTYETTSVATPTPASANNSAVFRLTSVPAGFDNVAVSFRLNNKQLVSTTGTPAVDWDGIHVFLRYVSEENLYYASVNRRDGSLAIKRKVPGGPSNGGTYYTLAGTSAGKYNIPFNTWQNIKASVKTNADGTVTIQIFRDGVLALSAVDDGRITGAAPITQPGKVGIRGDNDEFYFDDFTVDDPNSAGTPATTPPAPAPADTTAPNVQLTSPTAGATVVGTVSLSGAASDNVGVAKVEYYDGATLLGSSTVSPYKVDWDTTKVMNGAHSLRAVAYDGQQNAGQSSIVTVNVNNAVVATAADTVTPVITVTSPVDGTTGKSVSVKAAATDNVKVAKMQVYVDGALKYSTNGASVNTTQGLKAKGAHTVTVTATDSSNNIAKTNITVHR